MSAVEGARGFSTAPPAVSRSLLGTLGWRSVVRRDVEGEGDWEVSQFVIRIAGKEFKPATVKEEEELVRRVGEIVDGAPQPVEIIMSSNRAEVRRWLGEHFAIYVEGDQEIIGHKVEKEEDLGNGTTRVTYKNGREKVVLQPYSAKHHPRVIGMLGEGLEIPAEAPEQLELNNSVASVMMSLDGVTFKKGKDNQITERRFAQRVQAKHVCYALGLDRLVIPPAATVTMYRETVPYLFIAEKQLPVNTDPDVQEALYRACSDEVVQQLIRFIQETGMTGISRSTIPLFEDGKVALLNLDGAPNKDIGLLGAGTDSERGLYNDNNTKKGWFRWLDL